MKTYRLTTEAQADLDAIADYVAVEASVDRAIQVISDIRRELRRLGDSPGIGHWREEVLDHRYRFWSVYSYLIAYRADKRPIDILAIVHGARKLDAFFARRKTELQE